MPGMPRRGPALPYQLLAGVVPCPGGWLVAAGKLLGITLYPEEPEVIPSFRDVLEHVPRFDIVALSVPIGLPDLPQPGGRTCDREARQLLGAPRRGAVRSAPCRAALDETDRAAAAKLNGGHLDAVTWNLVERLREVAGEMQPYWQRTVFEIHPELSFFQINDDVPMTYPKRGSLGREERKALLCRKIHGIESTLDVRLAGAREFHLIDACAGLWTARRIAARAVQRMPIDPEWNELGLRVEMVR